MTKGTQGYIQAYKKKYGGYAFGLLAVIVISALIIFLITGTLKHIAIVIPVILALPFAKLLTLWVIVAKFRSLPKSEGERIQEQLKDRKNCVILYDMALSSYEAVSYAPCIVIDQGNVYLLWGGSNEKKYTIEKQREYVQGIVVKTGYDFQVTSYTSLEELLEAVEKSPVSEADVSLKCDRLKKRLLDICV